MQAATQARHRLVRDLGCRIYDLGFFRHLRQMSQRIQILHPNSYIELPIAACFRRELDRPSDLRWRIPIGQLRLNFIPRQTQPG
jgi:hypothetical protein